MSYPAASLGNWRVSSVGVSLLNSSIKPRLWETILSLIALTNGLLNELQALVSLLTKVVWYSMLETNRSMHRRRL